MKPILAALLLAGTSLAAPQHYANGIARITAYIQTAKADGVPRAVIEENCRAEFKRLLNGGYLSWLEHVEFIERLPALYEQTAAYRPLPPPAPRVPIKTDAQELQEAIDAQTEAIQRLESRITEAEIRRRSSFYYPTR